MIHSATENHQLFKQHHTKVPFTLNISMHVTSAVTIISITALLLKLYEVRNEHQLTDIADTVLPTNLSIFALLAEIELDEATLPLQTID